MRKLLLLLFVIFIPIVLYSQEFIDYKIAKDKTIKFEISNNYFFVKINESKMNKSNMDEYVQVTKNMALIKHACNDVNFELNCLNLKNKFKDQLLLIEPVLIYKDGIKQVCNNEITLKLTNEYPIESIIGNGQYIVTKNPHVKNQYLIKFENKGTKKIFELIGKLNENLYVEFAEPNFIRFLAPSISDPYFDYQWSIRNQGYLGGIVDADMDVDAAWSFATGEDIKIAVIDEGVDLQHPDLVTNLLPGYDATGNNSDGAPNINNNDAHGTCCAGIISAKSNDIGIAGVAYNAKIIPIRVAYSTGYPIGDYRRHWVIDDTWVQDGIYEAVNRGADIISNSWGGGNPSINITNAINNAVDNGRNGKGCVVLFSSGNDNSSVSYPATLEKVIAVGATGMCDERKSPSSCDNEDWWGSNYGDELDIVAPGVNIYSADISGTNGYSVGDYLDNFNGTSSACPNAAGVAALILSINPNFSQIEVRRILESSTDKLPGYNYFNSPVHPNGSWNNKIGYGRVNAMQAIYNCFIISGPSPVCISNSTFTLNNVPAGFTVNWDCSDNMEIVTENDSGCYICSLNGLNGIGTVSATIFISDNDSIIVEKEVWVGRPNKPVTSPSQSSMTDAQVGDIIPVEIISVEGGDKNMGNWWASGSISVSNPFLNPGTGMIFDADALGYGYWYVNVSNDCGTSYNTSGTVDVSNSGSGGLLGGLSLTLSPNPVSSEMTIDIEEEANTSKTTKSTQANTKYQVYIYHTVKGLVYTNVFTDSNFIVNANKIADGSYILKVVSSEGKVGQVHFIKGNKLF